MSGTTKRKRWQCWFCGRLHSIRWTRNHSRKDISSIPRRRRRHAPRKSGELTLSQGGPSMTSCPSLPSPSPLRLPFLPDRFPGILPPVTFSALQCFTVSVCLLQVQIMQQGPAFVEAACSAAHTSWLAPSKSESLSWSGSTIQRPAAISKVDRVATQSKIICLHLAERGTGAVSRLALPSG